MTRIALRLRRRKKRWELPNSGNLQVKNSRYEFVPASQVPKSGILKSKPKIGISVVSSLMNKRKKNVESSSSSSEGEDEEEEKRREEEKRKKKE